MSGKGDSKGGKSTTAQKQWELENNVKQVDPDAIYQYDPEKQQAVNKSKPWKEDIHYFKKVKMSALALLKMVMHATSGGRLEVMGLLQGKVDGQTFVVLDTFALPIEGTETRVDAGASQEAIEYMAQYTTLGQSVGRNEVVVGWYHSHPGYGCWLSGIDCTTQMNNQRWQDPFLAVVIDPVRTMAAGKVEIGGFRTYPEGYKHEGGSSEYENVPLDKIEDFGVHAKAYYKLDIEYFKSTTDDSLLNLLWNKYWINTLSSSPLLNNRDYTRSQILDLATKLDKAETELSQGARGGYSTIMSTEKSEKKKEEGALSKINKDSTKLTIEVMHGLISQVIKDSLFNIKTKQ